MINEHNVKLGIYSIVSLRKGKDNGIHAKDIGTMTRINERVVRKLIRSMIVDDGKVICAHPDNGFYVPATNEEVDHNLSTLGVQIKKLKEHLDALSANYYKGKELSLF